MEDILSKLQTGGVSLVKRNTHGSGSLKYVEEVRRAEVTIVAKEFELR